MITKKEFKKQLGFFIFGIGAWYTALAIRPMLEEALPTIPPWILGIIIMIIALYFFELD